MHGSEEALSPSLAQTGTPAGGCGPSADSLDPDASLLGWHCCSVNGRGQQQCSISGEFKSILYFTEVCICFFFFERIYHYSLLEEQQGFHSTMFSSENPQYLRQGLSMFG